MTDHYIRSLNETLSDLSWNLHDKKSELKLIDDELKKENLDKKLKEELQKEKENLEEDILDLKCDISMIEEILHTFQIQDNSYDHNWNESGYYDY